MSNIGCVDHTFDFFNLFCDVRQLSVVWNYRSWNIWIQDSIPIQKNNRLQLNLCVSRCQVLFCWIWISGTLKHQLVVHQTRHPVQITMFPLGYSSSGYFRSGFEEYNALYWAIHDITFFVVRHTKFRLKRFCITSFLIHVPRSVMKPMFPENFCCIIFHDWLFLTFFRNHLA